MNGYAASKFSLSHEEQLSLIEEKTLSDVESESGRADIETRFSTRRWAATARTYCKRLRLSSWRQMVARTGVFLLPSFVYSRGGARERARNDKIGPTAYLDGMRGLAALFVFFCHYFYTAFAIAEGWGHNDGNREVWKLPFVRLLVSGPSMVCLFFVISGYALSLKPLKQMRGRSFDGFATTMSSTVFRRGFRLFLPTAVSTFMVLVLLQLGAFERTREFAGDKNFVKNVVEFHPLLQPGLGAELRNWAWEMFNFVHVFGWEKFGGSTGYDVHLWTIPVEYRCSMMLFLVMFGTARLRTGARFFCVAAISLFVLRNDRWEMFLFLAGMFLAELDIIRGAHNPPAPSVLPYDEAPPAPGRRRDGKAKAALWIALSVVGMYFMSEPDLGTEGVYGWETLGSLIPDWFSDKYRFWQVLGAVLFVYAVGRSPPWQRLFNTRPIQYFGKISYAMYLMHGPVQHTVGYAVERWVWGLTGTEGQAYNAGFALAACVNIPLVIWAADLFWRGVDAPIVRFTRWLEARCLATE